MKEKLDFVRLPIVLILIAFVGRLVMSVMGASYDVGNRVFSMVILQAHLALLWGAWSRAHKGYGAGGAIQVGVLIGLASQILIFSGTAFSYLTGINTYFNNPIAITGLPDPVSFGTAMLARAGGLVANCIISGILASIGYAMAGLIPKERAQH